MTSLSLIAAVAVGGALGAVGRFGVAGLAVRWVGIGFPTGTLTVNVVGSFFMGLLLAVMAVRTDMPPELRLFLTVGLLGAFTTFSTFSLDVFILIERGQWMLCAGYIVLSVLLSIAALFGGVALGRGIWAS